jgi:DNA-directed RNA polymerase specialized sigma24 family protein
LEYNAFCQLHRDRYCAYARARIGNAILAERAVADALGDLAVIWRQALSSSAPAAWAWDLLSARVRVARRSPYAPAGGDGLHRMLPALQADTVLLRHRMMLTMAETACLLGLDISLVASTLATARRTLRKPLVPASVGQGQGG